MSLVAINIHLGVLMAYGQLKSIVCVTTSMEAAISRIEAEVGQHLQWHEEFFVHRDVRMNIPDGRVSTVHSAIVETHSDPNAALPNPLTDALIITYMLRLPKDVESIDLSDVIPPHLTGLEPMIGNKKK